MATITTTREQRETADAARRVGGYRELVRLAAERRRKGAGSTVVRNSENGRWSVLAPAAPSPNKG